MFLEVCADESLASLEAWRSVVCEVCKSLGSVPVQG